MGADDDDDLAAAIRETFAVCEDCGAMFAPRAKGGHQCPDESTTIEKTSEVAPAERERRRAADPRPDDTIVYIVPAIGHGNARAYHETAVCTGAPDHIEPTTLGTARLKNRVPCATPTCRRLRGDIVYGELYEPLEND